MRKGKDMERVEGLYIYKLDYKFEGNMVLCIPVRFHNGQAFVLSTDKKGCWSSSGLPIENFSIIDDETLFEELSKVGPIPYDKTYFFHDLIQIELDYGHFYKSIYRPLFTDYFRDGIFVPFEETRPSLDFYRDLPIFNQQEYSSLLRQLEIILDDLDAVFKVVAPLKKHRSVYGHAIRNIIILACTEIDSMMHNILERNGVKPYGSFFQMKDYYPLKEALRLDEYELSLWRFGDLGTFNPFAEWDGEKNPYWYDGYNKIKHNREKEFAKASLFYAINSLMAFAIILIAQYGYRNDVWNEKIGKIIRIDKEPLWDLKDFYLLSSDNSVSITYPFPKNKMKISPTKQLAKEIQQLTDNIDSNKDEIIRKLDELKRHVNND